MASITGLPAAALSLILSHLDCERDAASARLCSKHLADISCASVSSISPKHAEGLVYATNKFKALKHVDLRYIRSIDASEAASLAQLKGLQRLSLLDNSCWDAVRGPMLSAMSTSCPALTALEVSGVTDDLASLQLARLTQLHSLAISGRISDAALSYLSALQDLQQLSLSCCDAISDTGVQLLTSFRALNSLQLHSCLQLGDAALQLLGQLTQLTSLSLSHSCEDASSAGLLCLSTLKHLKALNLSAASEAAAPNAMAQLLASLPQLVQLDVSYCESVGPAVLRAIAGLHQLQVLGLSGINPGSLHSLRSLKHLSKLQQLQLRWVGQLKDAHASFFPHLVALTALDLSYCRSLTGEGLQQLQWLTQLRQLNLNGVGVEELGCLGAMQQLTGLTVSLLPQTSHAWQRVASLQQLQALALRRCTIATGENTRQAGSSSSSNSDGGGNSSGPDDEVGTTDTPTAAAAAAAAQPGLPKYSPNFAALVHLQQLTALDCSGSSLQAAALTVLQQLPHLQHLGLSRCQNVSNAVLGVLGGCSALRKVDLRLRGSGCCWNLRGLVGFLEQLPGLGLVFVSEVPVELPQKEASRVLACSTEQVPLPVARDAGCRLGPTPLF